MHNFYVFNFWIKINFNIFFLMHEVKKMSGLYNCANILMKKNNSLKNKFLKRKS